VASTISIAAILSPRRMTFFGQKLTAQEQAIVAAI
jgi:hypothetical protein